MKFILQITLIVCFSVANAQQISTIAGMLDSTGILNNKALLSKFNNPHGIAINTIGEIFIADRFNHVIRKIDTNGNVYTLAGSGTIGKNDGLGSQASFNEPWDIEVDQNGFIIVADTRNNLIRRISPTGEVTTIAGTGSFGFTDNTNPLAASFGNPSGIAIDKNNNIYVADHLTHLIRKISFSGAVSTLAGSKVNFPNNYGADDGTGSQAKFYRPYGISIGVDNNLYVADEWNHLIRKVSLSGKVTTIAGNNTIGNQNGLANQSSFNYPWDIIQDSNLNLYVIDGYNHVIRKIDTTNHVSDFMGLSGISGATDGNSSVGTLNGATGLTIDKVKNTIYIADTYNELIRKININNIAPRIETNKQMICQYDSITVTVSPQIFNSYEYYINDSLFITTTNASQQIIIPFKGIIKVQVRGIHTDYDLLSNIILLNSFPNDKPLITYDTSVLVDGDSIVLKSSLKSSYLWSTGDTTRDICVTKAGSYSVTSTNTFGCINTSNNVIITKENEVNYTTIKVIGDVNLCPLDSCILIAKKNNPIWYKNNVPYASFDSNITVKDSGNYYFVYYDSLGGLNFSDTITINNKTLIKSHLNYKDTAFLIIPLDYKLYITDTINDVLSWNDTLLNDSLIPTEFGNYFATYSSNGCKQNTDTISINKIIELKIGIVNSNGTITYKSKHSFCIGDSTLIIADYDSVLWYVNDSVLSNSDSILRIDTSCSVYYTYIHNSQTIISDTIKLIANKTVKPQLSITKDTVIFKGELIMVTSDMMGDFLWSNGSYNDSIYIDSTQLLSLKTTDTNGCVSLSDSLLIKTIETPQLILKSSNGQFFCSNDSAIITSNYNSVTWVSNDSIVNSNVNHLKVFQTSSVYSYYDTLGRRFYSDTISLTQLPIINAFISSNSSLTFYQGDSVSLFANNLINYNWNTGDTTIKNIIKTSDTLWFTGVDSNGCTSYSDTVLTKVIIIPTLHTALLGDSIICNGDSTALLSNVPQPNWYRDSTLLGDSSTILYVKQPGAYYYNYYFNNDTTLYADTIYIQKHNTQPPTLNITSDTNLYYGNSIQVETNLNYSSYLWSNGDTNASMLVDTSTSTFVTVKDNNGCLATSDTVNVAAIILPYLKVYTADDTAICLGESTSLQTYRSNTESVTWFRNNQVITANIESLNIRDSGYYYYKTLFRNDTLLVSDSIWIEVYQLPEVDFNVEKTLLNKTDNIVYATPLVSPKVIDYEWNFGDEYAGDLENISNQKEANHTYFYPGLYSVSLLVTDINGCKNRVEKSNYIRVENDLFIPTGFTPNGDGENDFFRPLGGGINEGEILIFNQWGELIFQTNNIDKGWDGTRNSKQVESGNYTYIMKLIDVSSSVTNKKGVISLIR